MSGVTRQSYSPEITFIRVMCTGRVDLSFVFRAFMKGADGVFIGGCWPGECHYVTEGNYDALGNMHLSRKLMKHIGLYPERLRLEWIAASEGSRFAEVMDDFIGKVKKMGPLGEGEGMDEKALKFNLETVNSLVPYIKLVERERLRVPHKSEEAYNTFYSSDEMDKLFKELIADKLAISQIVALLKEGPRSAGEISETLSLDPSDLSRHLNVSAMQGLIRFENNLVERVS